MDKWISIAAVTMAATVAACTASQDSFKVQPVLSFDGKPIKDSGAAEYKTGKQLLSQGRFALAAQAFQASLFADGASVEVLNALAVSYDKLGRYDLSDRYYQRALTLDPNNPQTVNNLAVSLAQRGAPDLAAKVLADAHAQRPADTMIADNLKLAQKGVTAEPSASAAAPLPSPAAFAVPRIEQTGPSTQQLVTFGAHAAAASHQPTLTPVTVGATADKAPATTQADETESAELSALSASAKLPVAVIEPPAATVPNAHVGITAPSPSAQQLVSSNAAHPNAVLRPGVMPLVVTSATDAVPANMDGARALAVSAPEVRPAIVSEVLPPPLVRNARPPEAQKIAAVPPLQTGSAPAAESRTTAVPPPVVSSTPAVQGVASVVAAPVLALARSRLGSRIAESGNIQPLDIGGQKSVAHELALARLGARVEVANGAGRRYMAARMKTFLDGRGFDVSHIINARSFDHVQTVIVYRDQYQKEALSLARSLTTKVELVHVPDLSVDVRLILGRDLLAFDRTLANGG